MLPHATFCQISILSFDRVVDSRVNVLANPLQNMNRTSAAPARPPPILGEHIAEILKDELNLDVADLELLQADEVIGIG